MGTRPQMIQSLISQSRYNTDLLLSPNTNYTQFYNLPGVSDFLLKLSMLSNFLLK